MTMKRHRWENVRRTKGQVQRCVKPNCDVMRFRAAMLGWVYGVRYGSLQQEQHPCPTELRVADFSVGAHSPNFKPVRGADDKPHGYFGRGR
jgi:hypothetical protein